MSRLKSILIVAESALEFSFRVRAWTEGYVLIVASSEVIQLKG